MLNPGAFFRKLFAVVLYPFAEPIRGCDHVHDFHATILHLMGLDHTKVIYKHKGRPERVDLNEGHVHEGIAGA